MTSSRTKISHADGRHRAFALHFLQSALSSGCQTSESCQVQLFKA